VALSSAPRRAAWLPGAEQPNPLNRETKTVKDSTRSPGATPARVARYADLCRISASSAECSSRRCQPNAPPAIEHTTGLSVNNQRAIRPRLAADSPSNRVLLSLRSAGPAHQICPYRARRRVRRPLPRPSTRTANPERRDDDVQQPAPANVSVRPAASGKHRAKRVTPAKRASAGGGEVTRVSATCSQGGRGGWRALRSRRNRYPRLERHQRSSCQSAVENAHDHTRAIDHENPIRPRVRRPLNGAAESVAEYCDRTPPWTILGGCEGSPMTMGRTKD